MPKKAKIILCVIFVIFYYILLFWGAFRIFVFIDPRPISNTNTPISEVIPWGIWESEDPPLILYILPEYRLWTENPNLYSFPVFFRNKYGYFKLISYFSSIQPFIGRHHPNQLWIGSVGDLVVDAHGGTFGLINNDGFKIIDGLFRIEVKPNEEVYIFYPAVNFPSINTEERWLGNRFVIR